ncbi:DMT family transporter [Stappia stellulata]|uniref:EamA family transporter n=1 Tax=Stappia stellulata TaxID=71235 RepID=UPI001CD48214|nr:DMT family transporter [Stappia stellulata]MCA1240814.1 DMT family transporter [Stappia stellulata]
MSSFALALVLTAAVLHAAWNAMVKAGSDRALILACVAIAHTIVGAAMIAVAPAPAPESWPYIAASAALHYLYYILLFLAYRIGDLSQVYPIARGLSPLLVSIGAFLFAGELLSLPAAAGIALISGGIALLSFVGRRAPTAQPAALAAAVSTGVVIASYSLVDGIGVRLSESAFGYTGWLFVSEALVVAVVARRRWGQLRPMARPIATYTLLAGVSAVSAYALVIYANLLAPLGAVSAVREVSVVVAAGIGVLIFGERPWKSRVFAAAAVTAGVVLLAAN